MIKVKTLLLYITFFTLMVSAGCSKPKDIKVIPVNSNSSISKADNAQTEQKVSKGELLLKEMFELAKKGEIPNCEFQSKTSLIERVEEKWGKADKKEAAGKGIYATYLKQGVTFGFNKGSQIFDVRSYDSKLKDVKYSDAEKALGKPKEVNNYNGQDIMIYDVNIDFQLMLIFPEQTKENPDPALDHTSVYCPQAAVSLIAENSSGIKESNRYNVAGIDNAAEFEAFFNKIKELVAKGEKEKVAEYIKYPINVFVDGNTVAVSTKDHFIKNYDKIFNSGVKKAVLNQKVEDAFVSWRGVMAGSGEVWFSKFDEKYLIYAINNNVK